MSSKPRFAVITTIYRRRSHSDVIATRWMEPFPADDAFGWPVNNLRTPRSEIASLYIARFPQIDIGRETAEKYQVPIFSSIRDALTLGSNELAVDGILLIAEQGRYPRNKWGQEMYPRREFFDEIVNVFEEFGKTVPVFCDKHFSYDMESADYMIHTARRMGFPLMGGSSIPLAAFAQPWNLPQNLHLEEGVGIFYSDPEAYGYHSIEFLQALVAQRHGGESGIKNVTAYCGEDFWKAMDALPQDLMEAALKQISHKETGDYRNNLSGKGLQPPFHEIFPVAFSFTHNDGLKTHYAQLHGHIRGFSIAAQDKNGKIYSGSTHSGIKDAITNVKREEIRTPHFAIFDAKIEEFLLTGKMPFPEEHYALCTLAISTAMHALEHSGETIQTPELNIEYSI